MFDIQNFAAITEIMVGINLLYASRITFLETFLDKVSVKSKLTELHKYLSTIKSQKLPMLLAPIISSPEIQVELDKAKKLESKIIQQESHEAYSDFFCPLFLVGGIYSIVVLISLAVNPLIPFYFMIAPYCLYFVYVLVITICRTLTSIRKYTPVITVINVYNFCSIIPVHILLCWVVIFNPIPESPFHELITLTVLFIPIVPFLTLMLRIWLHIWYNTREMQGIYNRVHYESERLIEKNRRVHARHKKGLASWLNEHD